MNKQRQKVKKLDRGLARRKEYKWYVVAHHISGIPMCPSECKQFATRKEAILSTQEFS